MDRPAVATTPIIDANQDPDSGWDDDDDQDDWGDDQDDDDDGDELEDEPWRWRGGWEYFPPSRPRKVQGGIRAHTLRGSIGGSWWSRRWIEVLESFGIGTRLKRGLSYARSGQVISIDIKPGQVTASVQGSRRTPYDVTIGLRAYDRARWSKMATSLRTQPHTVARMLAGALPEDVDDVFCAAGMPLFPSRARDLETECSCPDWSNPCKHLAAVYYLLAEELDRDPMLLLRLRGIERDELVALLDLNTTPAVTTSTATATTTAATVAGDTPPRNARVAVAAAPPRPAMPLPVEPEQFWCVAGPVDIGDLRVPDETAPLVRRMGSFPLWRGAKPFAQALQPWYERASAVGAELALATPTRDDEYASD